MKEVPTSPRMNSSPGQFQRRQSVEMRDERTSPRTSSSPKNSSHWQKRTSVEMTDEKVDTSPRMNAYNSSPKNNQQNWQQKRHSVEMKEENRVSPRGNHLHWSPRGSVERFPPLGGSPKTYSVPSTSPRVLSFLPFSLSTTTTIQNQQWQKREFNDQKPKNQRNPNNNYFHDNPQKNNDQWNKRISVEMKDEKQEVSPRSKSFGQQQHKEPQQVNRSVDMTDQSFFSQHIIPNQFHSYPQNFPPANQFAPPPQNHIPLTQHQPQQQGFNRPLESLFYHQQNFRQQFREQNQTIPKLNFPFASFQEPLAMQAMNMGESPRVVPWHPV